MVYALGGMGPDTAPQAQVRVYEPRRDCWLSLPSMPTPCYGASTFLHGNKIYVLGKGLGVGAGEGCGKGARSAEAPIFISWLGSGLVWDGRTREVLGEPGLLGGSDLWWPY